MRNKEDFPERRTLFISLFLCRWIVIEPDPGMNPAEAAEEAPSDPDTDAFYKTGRKSRCTNYTNVQENNA